jgi:hypothetical protein
MLSPYGRSWLRHYHYDVFETFAVDPKEGIDTTEKSQLSIQFDMNVAGDVNTALLALEPGLKPLEFLRKPKVKEIGKGELTKYVGDFELSPEAVAKFYIKGDKTLYAFIEGQPEYELEFTGKNKFSIKLLPGYTVQFEENEKGGIVAVNFIQPNGTFTAKRKK